MIISKPVNPRVMLWMAHLMLKAPRSYTTRPIALCHIVFLTTRAVKDDLALLLRAAGRKGKKAFLEKESLSLVNTYTLLAAKVPINKQAEDFFADKPQAIIVGQRNTQHAKDKPRFMHYFKESRINSHSVILPLEFRVHRNILI